jgi:hypothetical protein
MVPLITRSVSACWQLWELVYLGLPLIHLKCDISITAPLPTPGGEVYSMQHHVIKFVSDLRKVDWWFSPGTPVSSTKNTDHHDIIEISLKVALNTIALTHKYPPFVSARRSGSGSHSIESIISSVLRHCWVKREPSNFTGMYLCQRRRSGPKSGGGMFA